MFAPLSVPLLESMGSELTDPLLFLAFQYMADNLAKKKEGQQIIVLQRILSSDDVNFGYDEGAFEAGPRPGHDSPCSPQPLHTHAQTKRTHAPATRHRSTPVAPAILTSLNGVELNSMLELAEQVEAARKSGEQFYTFETKSSQR